MERQRDAGLLNEQQIKRYAPCLIFFSLAVDLPTRVGIYPFPVSVECGLSIQSENAIPAGILKPLD